MFKHFKKNVLNSSFHYYILFINLYVYVCPITGVAVVNAEVSTTNYDRGDIWVSHAYIGHISSDSFHRSHCLPKPRGKPPEIRQGLEGNTRQHSFGIFLFKNNLDIVLNDLDTMWDHIISHGNIINYQVSMPLHADMPRVLRLHHLRKHLAVVSKLTGWL